MNLDEIIEQAASFDRMLEEAGLISYEYNVYDPVTRAYIGTLYTAVDKGKEFNGLLIRSDDNGKA